MNKWINFVAGVKYLNIYPKISLQKKTQLFGSPYKWLPLCVICLSTIWLPAETERHLWEITNQKKCSKTQNTLFLSPSMNRLGLQASQKCVYVTGRDLGLYIPQAWHSLKQEKEGEWENKRHGCFCSVCRRLMETHEMDKPVMFTDRQEQEFTN